MKVELALALRDDAHDAIVTRMTWDEESQGEYTGPVTDRQYKLFSYMQDFTQRQKLFRKPTLGGRVWTLWSVMFDDDIDVLQIIQDEIDQLALDYPSQVVIAGAFHWAGNQVGTQLVLTEVPNPEYTGEPYMIPNPDYQPDLEQPDYDPRAEIRNPAWVPEFITEKSQTGTPTYPLHPQLIEFMPDVDDVGTRPTELSDTNLLFGQGTRIFA